MPFNLEFVLEARNEGLIAGLQQSKEGFRAFAQGVREDTTQLERAVSAAGISLRSLPQLLEQFDESVGRFRFKPDFLQGLAESTSRAFITTKEFRERVAANLEELQGDFATFKEGLQAELEQVNQALASAGLSTEQRAALRETKRAIEDALTIDFDKFTALSEQKRVYEEIIATQGQFVSAQDVLRISNIETVESLKTQLDALALSSKAFESVPEVYNKIQQIIVATRQKIRGLGGELADSEGKIRKVTSAELELRNAQILTTQAIEERRAEFRRLRQEAGEDLIAQAQITEQIEAFEERVRAAREGQSDLTRANVKTTQSYVDQSLKLKRLLDLHREDGIAVRALQGELARLAVEFRRVSGGISDVSLEMERGISTQEKFRAQGILTYDTYLEKRQELSRQLEEALLLPKSPGGDLDPSVGVLINQLLELESTYDSLRGTVKQLGDEIVVLGENGQETTFHISQINNVDFSKSIGQQQRLQRSMKTSNFALQNFAFILQDSAQFGISFDQGLRAIANNLDATIFALNQAYESTKRLHPELAKANNQSALWGITLSTVVKSLKSPLGFLVLINIITSGVQILTQVFNRGKKEADAYTQALTGVFDVVQATQRLRVGAGRDLDALIAGNEVLIKNLKDQQRELKDFNRELQELQVRPDLSLDLNELTGLQQFRLRDFLRLKDGFEEFVKILPTGERALRDYQSGQITVFELSKRLVKETKAFKEGLEEQTDELRKAQAAADAYAARVKLLGDEQQGENARAVAFRALLQELANNYRAATAEALLFGNVARAELAEGLRAATEIQQAIAEIQAQAGRQVRLKDLEGQPTGRGDLFELPTIPKDILIKIDFDVNEEPVDRVLEFLRDLGAAGKAQADAQVRLFNAGRQALVQADAQTRSAEELAAATRDAAVAQETFNSGLLGAQIAQAAVLRQQAEVNQLAVQIAAEEAVIAEEISLIEAGRLQQELDLLEARKEFLRISQQRTDIATEQGQTGAQQEIAEANLEYARILGQLDFAPQLRLAEDTVRVAQLQLSVEKLKQNAFAPTIALLQLEEEVLEARKEVIEEQAKADKGKDLDKELAIEQLRKKIQETRRNIVRLQAVENAPDLERQLLLLQAEEDLREGRAKNRALVIETNTELEIQTHLNTLLRTEFGKQLGSVEARLKAEQEITEALIARQTPTQALQSLTLATLTADRARLESQRRAVLDTKQLVVLWKDGILRSMEESKKLQDDILKKLEEGEVDPNKPVKIASVGEFESDQRALEIEAETRQRMREAENIHERERAAMFRQRIADVKEERLLLEAQLAARNELVMTSKFQASADGKVGVFALENLGTLADTLVVETEILAKVKAQVEALREQDEIRAVILNKAKDLKIQEESLRQAGGDPSGVSQQLEDARKRSEDLPKTIGQTWAETAGRQQNAMRDMGISTTEYLLTTEEGFAALGTISSNVFGAIGTFAEIAFDKSDKTQRKWWKVMKATKVAEAIVSTYTAANLAASQTGIFSFLAVPAVIAMGLANVAKILATEPGKSSAAGGGGSIGTAPDRFANLASSAARHAHFGATGSPQAGTGGGGGGGFTASGSSGATAGTQVSQAGPGVLVQPIIVDLSTLDLSSMPQPRISVEPTQPIVLQSPDLNQKVVFPELPPVNISVGDVVLDASALQSLRMPMPEIAIPRVEAIIEQVIVDTSGIQIQPPAVSIPELNIPTPPAPVITVQVDTPEVQVPVPDVQVVLPDVQVDAPQTSVQVDAPVIQLTTPSPAVGSLIVNVPPVDVPTPRIDLTGLSASPQPTEVQPIDLSGLSLSVGSLDLTGLSVEAPRVSVEAPQVSVEVPRVSVETTAPELDISEALKALRELKMPEVPEVLVPRAPEVQMPDLDVSEVVKAIRGIRIPEMPEIPELPEVPKVLEVPEMSEMLKVLMALKTPELPEPPEFTASAAPIYVEAPNVSVLTPELPKLSVSAAPVYVDVPDVPAPPKIIVSAAPVNIEPPVIPVAEQPQIAVSAAPIHIEAPQVQVSSPPPAQIVMPDIDLSGLSVEAPRVSVVTPEMPQLVVSAAPVHVAAPAQVGAADAATVPVPVVFQQAIAPEPSSFNLPDLTRLNDLLTRIPVQAPGMQKMEVIVTVEGEIKGKGTDLTAAIRETVVTQRRIGRKDILGLNG